MLLSNLLLAQAATALDPLAGHALVYSPRDKNVLLIGGDADGSGRLYRLSEGAWLAIPGSEMPCRSLAAVAADDQGNLLLHGGSVRVAQPEGLTDFQVRGDTWRWD